MCFNSLIYFNLFYNKQQVKISVSYNCRTNVVVYGVSKGSWLGSLLFIIDFIDLFQDLYIAISVYKKTPYIYEDALFQSSPSSSQYLLNMFFSL